MVKWVLSLGPDAPTTPAIEIEPYLWLLKRDCAGALRSADRVFGNQDDPRGAVYRGAANACLAAFHGQPQRWAPARRQLAIALAGSANLRCAERTTLAWLESVVGLHDEDRARGAVGVRIEQGTQSELADLIPDPGGGGASFTVPEGLAPGAAEVVVLGYIDDWQMGRVAFTYEAGG